eukprot:m.311541 g.311541  ORF g.311541 m.311541 type:complete len:51 (-) comp20225_c1_seq4:1267-1419(-)
MVPVLTNYVPWISDWLQNGKDVMSGYSLAMEHLPECVGFFEEAGIYWHLS